MNANELQAGKLETLATKPIGLEINFSTINKVRFLAKEIKQCVITGEIGPQHEFNGCNIVASKLKATTAHKANFANMDFKDCIFTECILSQSEFSDGAIASTFFNGGQFEECSFRDMAVTDTEFRHVAFRRCDLSKLMIKSCRFYNCEFIDCKTSNKLFESSLVLDCTFYRTELELGSISNNFGIVADQVSEMLRDLPLPTADETHDKNVYIQRIARNAKLSAIEIFRLHYYFNSAEALVSQEFDNCLSASSWEELIWLPSNFISTYNDFFDFVLHLYDTNKVAAYVLWRLQTVTAEFAERLGNQNREISGLLLRPLSGIQATISRLLEEQIAIQDELCQLYAREVTFLVNGPLDRAFYLLEFQHWFEGSSAEIIRLVPHNSPAELTIIAKTVGDLTPFIALLVCTRFSLEIQKLRLDTTKALSARSSKKNSSAIVSLQPQTDEVSTFALSIGLTKDRKAYELKLMTILPGNHFLKFMLQLRLDVTSRTIARARSILHGILDRGG